MLLFWERYKSEVLKNIILSRAFQHLDFSFMVVMVVVHKLRQKI